MPEGRDSRRGTELGMGVADGAGGRGSAERKPACFSDLFLKSCVHVCVCVYICTRVCVGVSTLSHESQKPEELSYG